MNYSFIFWGSSRFSVITLETLKKEGFLPLAIVTSPDKAYGRGLEVKESEVKTWAKENNINVFTPNKMNQEFYNQISPEKADLFLVASYGKIIPSNFLNLPKYGSINIHPSLLPKYRGPSPLQSMILNNEKNIGVTLMLMDEEMDHGPIISNREIEINILDYGYYKLQEILAQKGALLFIECLKDDLNNLKTKNQDHSLATYTKKIEKKDGEIKLEDNDLESYLKYLAFEKWPGVFFFHKGKIRVKIRKAVYKDNKFIPLIVVPESRGPESYTDFLNRS